MFLLKVLYLLTANSYSGANALKLIYDVSYLTTGKS